MTTEKVIPITNPRPTRPLDLCKKYNYVANQRVEGKIRQKVGGLGLEELPEELFNKLFSEKGYLKWSEEDVKSDVHMGHTFQEVERVVYEGLLPEGLTARVLRGLIRRAELVPHED